MTNETFHSVSIPFTANRIRDLLVGAFEGGSNYWYSDLYPELAPGLTVDDFKGQGKFAVEDWREFPFYVIPFHPGCAISMLAEDHENPNGGRWVLNAEKMKSGLELMAKKHGSYFAELINERDDGFTSDVFLQLCVFGEVVFG